LTYAAVKLPKPPTTLPKFWADQADDVVDVNVVEGDWALPTARVHPRGGKTPLKFSVQLGKMAVLKSVEFDQLEESVVEQNSFT
jgi:hypothetical protein